MQAEAFAVVRKALQETGKVALGKIAFSGREHIIAVAPYPDDKLPGMMAYTLRYAEELRKPAEFFGNIKKAAVEEEQLSLAESSSSARPQSSIPQKFKDQYEVALRELVEAKVKQLPIPQEEPAPKSPKVINLMDALRKSVSRRSQKPAAKKPLSSPRRLSEGNAPLVNRPSQRNAANLHNTYRHRHPVAKRARMTQAANDIRC